MTTSDEEYCLRRAQEERARAAACADQDSAQRHVALAELFHLRATDREAWAAMADQQLS